MLTLKIERLLFQYYDNRFVDNTKLILQENDLLELDEIFGQKQEHFENENLDDWEEPIDFSIEEMLDMPTMGEKIDEPKVSDEADNESHDNSNHGIFCVTGKDIDLIDIDDLV